MKRRRVAMRHLPGVMLGFLVGISSACAYCTKGQRGAHLTYSGLMRVHIGASGGEVISHIGYPVAIKPAGGWKVAPLGHADPWPEGYIWMYATPNRWLFHEGLDVSLTMRDGHVARLNAEYDDMPIFVRAQGYGISHDEAGLRRLESELKR